MFDVGCRALAELHCRNAILWDFHTFPACTKYMGQHSLLTTLPNGNSHAVVAVGGGSTWYMLVLSVFVALVRRSISGITSTSY